MMKNALSTACYNGCQVCWSKDQQISAKDEVIRAKDAVIAAKDEAIAQKDLALRAERELRLQLQKQLKLTTGVVPKKASANNLKSASCKAQEERDSLTIYIRNVTDRITYEVLHDAFSAFGTIRMLNVLHPKACAFVEFSSPDAYQRALAAGSVPVGDGQESVLTEKRVRRPQQTFARRPSRDNLRGNAGNNGTTNTNGSNANGNTLSVPAQHSVYLSSNNSSTTSINSVDSLGYTAGGMHKGHGVYEDSVKVNGAWLRREDEGCDLTTTY